MTTGRLVFAAARDGILPRALSGVDRRGTPLAAVWAASAFAALFLLSGTYMALSSTTVSLGQAVYLSVMASAVALRFREPDLLRPWRAPAFGLVVAVAITINAALLIVFVMQDPYYALLGFALVAALAGGYLLFAGMGRKPATTEPIEWPLPN
jgi:amino acid transporter